MHVKLNRVLVVDVESTCWEDDEDRPRGQESEIIEIGWCLVHTHQPERKDRGTIIVRPAVSAVSEFCTRLTTLTQAHVDQGVSFADACDKLRVVLGAQTITWASYGDYDRKMFEKQTGTGDAGRYMTPWKARYPFGPRHINVKNLCALMLDWPKELGMDAALQKMGLPMEGTQHRGVDDAWNIAAILVELLRRGRSCAVCPAAGLPVLPSSMEVSMGLVCDMCTGSGRVADDMPCPACNGVGRKSPENVVCSACSGAGSTDGVICTACGGHGSQG